MRKHHPHGRPRPPDSADSSTDPGAGSQARRRNSYWSWARYDGGPEREPARAEDRRETMPRVIRSVLVSVFLGATTGVAQLPPEIMLDSYLLQAEQSIQEKDYAAARASMERILALQEEHEVVVSAEYHFRYARVWGRLGSLDRALESVVRYLELAGRQGEHYVEALKLMNKVKTKIEEVKAEAEAERKARAEEAKEMERALSAAAGVIAEMEFVRIPAGRFQMGSPAGSFGQPVTQVRISRAFEIGKYEVTQSEWEAVVGSNPSHFKNCGRDCPVEDVSWGDVQGFIDILNAAAGERGRYRLPTEAEWEYAARAGTKGDRYAKNVDAIAWCRDNSGERTHPVGLKAPNGYGLHDMLGNVEELVQDWLGKYPGGAVTDPSGPRSPTINVGLAGPDKVARGESFVTGCDTMHGRGYFQYNHGGYYLTGFRLVRTVQ